MIRILVVDDEPIMRKALVGTLTQSGYDVASASNGEEGVEALKARPADIVFSDIRMPRVGGIEFLERIKALNPDTSVVLMTAYGTIENAVEAMKKGAYDYLTKPFSFDEAVMIVKRIEEIIGLREENRDLRDENQTLKARLRSRFSFTSIIGKCERMQKVYSLVERIAPSDATVLIYGESGTGKELVANAIHENSPRKDRPFVAVNCSALSETLLESELFGHERGAFTGAVKDSKGRFEVADGGTLFLDEIGDISPAIQVKLLRVLQERKIEKVGGGRPVPVNVRILAATNRNLADLIREGKFREDLYYRINVIQVDLPPLRERQEDIPLLVEHFVRVMAEKNGRDQIHVSRKAMELMMGYPWPGNVRELINIAERAVLLCEGGRIEQADLPEPFKRVYPSVVPEGEMALAAVEKLHILRILEECGGNMSRASKILMVDRKTLYNKMKLYGEN